MARQTSYEVHVMQAGKWQIHARFNGLQKDAAVEEAKTLDAVPGIGKVKVIKEVYNPDEGLSEEFIVYKSSELPARGAGGDDSWAGGGGAKKKVPTVKSYGRQPDFDDDDEIDLDFDKPKKKAKKKRKRFRAKAAKPAKVAASAPPPRPTSVPVVLIKLLLILLFSVIMAMVGSLIASFVIQETFLAYKLSSNLKNNLLFVVFVLVFLASAIPMAARFMGKDTLAQRMTPPAPVRAKPAAPKPAAPAPEPVPEPEPEPEEPPKLAEMEIDLDQVVEAHEEAVEEEHEAAEAELEAEPEPEAEETDAEPPLSPQAEEQRSYISRFLQDTLTASGTQVAQMDNFNKFGLNLFLAGAAEVLGKVREVDDQSVNAILSGLVQQVGFKKDHADTFANKFGEYLTQDARYMQIFQAGRNAMNSFFTDEGAATAHLSKALEDWNKPKQREEMAGPVTVMFTDMVGSTNLTQTRGDAVAQEVVRAHNRIVRQALTEYNGKEIKHTGDGIMASFPTTSNAVEAAVKMQQGVMQHNIDYPDLPLHIKIGINAGEPIAEDNDLFGTTVQLSARITDKAKSEEIFVSEIVRGICAGTTLKFKSRGQYEMKGVSEPMTLYEVVYDAPGQAGDQSEVA